MIFPEPDILHNLVRGVFRIDDITLGDPREWIVRYRGQLLGEDSEAAYDRLADSVKPYGITPLFRWEGTRQVILLIPTGPAPKPTKAWVNGALFLLTVFSVMLAGARPSEAMPSDTLGQITLLLKNILTGWPFALSLLGILLAHEFGHYLMSRHHKTPATLPYFIPLPFSPLGTLGAAIVMQGTPKNTRTLFDIGVAGPLAGLVVAIPVLWIGLSISALGPVEEVIYPPLKAGEQAYCEPSAHLADGSYTCSTDNSLEGNSLLYLGMKYLRFRELLPAPADFNGQSSMLYWLRYFFTGGPVPLGGRDVFIDPVAFAGWAGLLVTALNLLPAGTLDGGHVVYSLFGEKAGKAFPFILLFLVLFGFFWAGWWLWAVLLLWLGRMHAQPLDQITRLDPGRKALAVVVILIFVLVFAPVPFVTF